MSEAEDKRKTSRYEPNSLTWPSGHSKWPCGCQSPLFHGRSDGHDRNQALVRSCIRFPLQVWYVFDGFFSCRHFQRFRQTKIYRFFMSALICRVTGNQNKTGKVVKDPRIAIFFWPRPKLPQKPTFLGPLRLAHRKPRRKPAMVIPRPTLNIESGLNLKIWRYGGWPLAQNHWIFGHREPSSICDFYHSQCTLFPVGKNRIVKSQSWARDKAGSRFGDWPNEMTSQSNSQTCELPFLIYHGHLWESSCPETRSAPSPSFLLDTVLARMPLQHLKIDDKFPPCPTTSQVNRLRKTVNRQTCPVLSVEAHAPWNGRKESPALSGNGSAFFILLEALLALLDFPFFIPLLLPLVFWALVAISNMLAWPQIWWREMFKECNKAFSAFELIPPGKKTVCHLKRNPFKRERHHLPTIIFHEKSGYISISTFDNVYI